MREEIDSIAPAPFLHDTTTENVIVTANGDISGIVDVDDLCFGDPRYPAALTLAALMACGGPVQYVSARLRHAGRSDDRVFRLYVALFLVDLMAEHGQTFNGNGRPSLPEARAALCRAFEQARLHLAREAGDVHVTQRRWRARLTGALQRTAHPLPRYALRARSRPERCMHPLDRRRSGPRQKPA